MHLLCSWWFFHANEEVLKGLGSSAWGIALHTDQELEVIRQPLSCPYSHLYGRVIREVAGVGWPLKSHQEKLRPWMRNCLPPHSLPLSQNRVVVLLLFLFCFFFNNCHHPKPQALFHRDCRGFTPHFYLHANRNERAFKKKRLFSFLLEK